MIQYQWPFLFATIIILLFQIWFCTTLQETMRRISPQNQKMSAGLVWLNFVPVVNFFWPFYYNNALIASLKEEFKGTKFKVDNAWISGMLYPLIWLILYGEYVKILYMYLEPVNGFSANTNDFDLFYFVFFLLAYVFFFVMFWIQITNLQDKLKPFGFIHDDHDIQAERIGDIHDERIDAVNGYRELLSQGAISQEEFDKLRKEILNL